MPTKKKNAPAKKKKSHSKKTPTKTKPKSKHKETQRTFFTYTDKPLGFECEVRDSANAWWKEQKEKILCLAEGFKTDLNKKQACFNAGITTDQFDYFIEIHPDFSSYFEMCLEAPNVKAKKTIVENLDDPAMAKWWAEKRLSDEFKNKIELDTKKEEVSDDDRKRMLKSQLEYMEYLEKKKSKKNG